MLTGFAASRLCSRRGVEILITALLAAYPLAYAWGAYAPGNHQTYIIVLLCMPPLFDSLAPPRYYWHWFAWAVFVVAATVLSACVGKPSMWMADFSDAVILMLHGAFLILWALMYVTRLQLGQYMEELADNIVKDKATGLPSIVAFRDAFGRDGRIFVVLIAISNFRSLSALFGYSVSTEVLAIAASRLLQAQAPLGGDAFRLRGHDIGFIKALEGNESPHELIRRLREALSGPLVFQGRNIELSYRMGYTVIEDGDAEKSLDQAEEALELAERDGLDVAAYSGSWHQVSQAEIAIADLMTLSRNISEKTIGVFYQPVVALSSGKTAWNEALVRFWENGEYCEEPSRFMTLAATTGHWAAIEDFIFESTAARVASHQGAVSFNIGMRDLDREDFRNAVETGARKAKSADSTIILEILESDFTSMGEKRLEILKDLRKAGCLIAIDDFGMGYSNYSRIFTMPIDIIKFDKSMIYSARSSKAQAMLVQGLLRFCYDIGALTVAEGIETKAYAEFVTDLGFDFGQGYYWSRPVPAAEAKRAEMTPLLGSRLRRFDE
ncbi:MAG: GGDEF domain-containing protein [Rectinemataceae bacterium]|nr:GGDEF domain-containing protein [Rectinemataceae bacterium]